MPVSNVSTYSNARALKTIDWEQEPNKVFPSMKTGRTEIFMVQRLANADGTEMEYGFVVHDKIKVSYVREKKTVYTIVESFENFSTEKEAEDSVDEYIKLRHSQGYTQKEPS